MGEAVRKYLTPRPAKRVPSGKVVFSNGKTPYRNGENYMPTVDHEKSHSKYEIK